MKTEGRASVCHRCVVRTHRIAYYGGWETPTENICGGLMAVGLHHLSNFVLEFNSRMLCFPNKICISHLLLHNNQTTPITQRGNTTSIYHCLGVLGRLDSSAYCGQATWSCWCSFACLRPKPWQLRGSIMVSMISRPAAGWSDMPWRQQWVLGVEYMRPLEA